ncbi:MAG: sulfurtransferase [Candidatus Proteinoplasmatales archaeon SG8-5]|nr:MAG: sulfurtransferase [Candidatus Proteinoplasmatales archaeon SG8-5]
MNGRIIEHPILPEPPEATVPFTFNDREMLARENEVISSALFANGIGVFNLHHKDSAPQGIFCANGQCAQCLVLVDGSPAKACITPVRAGMNVRSLDGLPELPHDDEPVPPCHITEREVQVLIVGAGPAGLSAAVELGQAGIEVLIVDDKQELGGKLSLQTHNFFGSIRDCNAGMRGMDIGTLLAGEMEDLSNVTVWLESPVVGVFADGKVGIVKTGIYHLVRPNHVLFSTGAREKSLAFPGCDLPGVYGAGAFQTIVNRDMVRSSSRLLIVGGGNVGLIAAYHAVQAGIGVLGVVEALPECGGYKVHEDKIKRLGIPVRTSHTVTKAEGDGRVERVTIAQADEHFNPVPGTERTYECDTLLIAVGLDPVNELTEKAKEFGYSVYEAGDAAEIAEASAAMFSGRITGRKMLKDMGHEAFIPEEWLDLLGVLRAKPGPVHEMALKRPGIGVYPVIRCNQEIPCNPCTAVCPKNSIRTEDGSMSSVPLFGDECVGCTRCVVICPGLAITLVDRAYDPSGERALVTLPWEMPAGSVKPSKVVITVGYEGETVGQGKVVAVRNVPWQNRRRLLLVDVPAGEADLVAGIRICEPPEEEGGEPATKEESRGTVVCRCERVTRGEIIDYIRETGCTDFNALKAALRVGMGPCGGKTCTELVMRIFRGELGADAEIEPHVERPLFQEVPLKAFLEAEK